MSAIAGVVCAQSTKRRGSKGRPPYVLGRITLLESMHEYAMKAHLVRVRVRVRVGVS